jgi:HSP20 family protein
MPEYRIKVAPDTVAYADGENHKLVVEFAIPGAPTDTIDVKILEDCIHLTAPARDIEYVSALALGWPGRRQSGWRGNQDQNNQGLMTR